MDWPLCQVSLLIFSSWILKWKWQKVSWCKIHQILAFLQVRLALDFWEKNLLWIFFVQHPRTGATHGDVAQLDDKGRSLLWKVRAGWISFCDSSNLTFIYVLFTYVLHFFLFVIISISGVSASFGEMLLLVAMYFHSNQLSAIIDLVCSTLGMKVNPKLFLACTFVS